MDHRMASPPPPGTFAARKMRVDAIMRALADRHEAKRGAASGLAAMGHFLAERRSLALQAAVLRAAALKN